MLRYNVGVHYNKEKLCVMVLAQSITLVKNLTAIMVKAYDIKRCEYLSTIFSRESSLFTVRST